MKVHVDKIGSDGLDLDEPLTQASLESALGKRSIYKPTGDGRVTVHLTRFDDAVHVYGRIQVELASTCSRCVAPVSVPVASILQVTMVPRGDEPQANDEGELAEEDLGVSSYDGEEIDLAQVVQDEVFLELPMSVLCRPDCAGLCATCGKDQNESPCGCAAPVDMRWSALKNVRLN